MWRCLGEDEVTAVLLNTDFDVVGDPRLEFLLEFDDFSLVWMDEFLGGDLPDGFFRLDGREPRHRVWKYTRKALRHTGYTTKRARKRLKELDADVCVFEWSSGNSTCHAEIYEATTDLGIYTACVPHGLNPHLNIGCTPGRADSLRRNVTERDDFNMYDASVYQSEFHRNQDLRLGLDPEKSHVLGSTRYYPEWQRINHDLHPTYEPDEQVENATKAVFMIPHWRYNANKPVTVELVEQLSTLDWLHLIVKDHTRGETLPESTRRQLADRSGVTVTNEDYSVSLIDWADVVLNFGSSIGLEALLQGKHHVNPTYLHRNTTIYDMCEQVLTTYTHKESQDTLERIHDGAVDSPSDADRARGCRDVIYAGKAPFNVLDRYYELLVEQP